MSSPVSKDTTLSNKCSIQPWYGCWFAGSGDDAGIGGDSDIGGGKGDIGGDFGIGGGDGGSINDDGSSGDSVDDDESVGGGGCGSGGGVGGVSHQAVGVTPVSLQLRAGLSLTNLARQYDNRTNDNMTHMTHISWLLKLSFDLKQE